MDGPRPISSSPQPGHCRFCGAPLRLSLVDLGMSPLCESYLRPEDLNRMEPFYPLHALVCEQCYLVQLQEYVSGEEIFSHYAYFSSYSDSYVDHARQYTEKMIDRLPLTAESQVVEVASNDGYLLQHFVARDIPSLGIEPAANIAAAARDRGVSTLVEFFGRALATQLEAEGTRADLLIGNNVLAQVPDINDFVAGLKILLAPSGVLTLEFPHLMRLVAGNQFDTIYHEHYSYFSLITTQFILGGHDLTLFDVEEITTHGGSLRVYARHTDSEGHPVTDRVHELRDREEAAGMTRPEFYESFSERVKETKRKLLDFLIQARREGHSIAAYGAPGKGNTLLNYCGVRTDFIDFAVDRNPFKHGKFLPGTHIPIFPPDHVREAQPDYLLILPWNLREEIMDQMDYIREWGGQFVVPIPEVRVYS